MNGEVNTKCLIIPGETADYRSLTPIFKTLIEWNKEKVGENKKSVFVKKGEIPSVIVSPVTNTFLFILKEKYEEWNNFKLFDKEYSSYFKNKIVSSSDDDKYLNKAYEKNDGKFVFLDVRNYKDKKLVYQIMNEAINRKIGVKKSATTFRKIRNQFSIDQTDYPEELRAEYIKRFDTKDYNPEEGKKIYTQLQAVANGLGLNVVEDNENHAYIGYASWIHNNMIYILNTMPIESKVKVLSHELGHFVLQKNIKDFESKYSRDRSIYEIQAELFASLFTSYFDILNKDEIDENGEKHKTYSDFSHFYISGYMKSLKKSLSLVENDSNFKNLHELTQAECDEIRSNAVKDLFFKQFDVCDRASKLLINACEAVETSDSEKFLDNIKKLESFPGYDFAWQPKYKNWYMIANKEILPMTQDFNNRGDIYREKALEEIKEKDEAKANKQIIEADKTIEMEM